MATASEDTDFITCSVCFCEFDTSQRLPKFLQCFHTICLQCLQDICKNQNIVCPLCRARTPCSKGPHNLTNNFHALHIVDMKKKENQVSNRSITWCLNCAEQADYGCLEIHNTIDVPSSKVEDGKQLQEAFVTCKSKLTTNIRRLQGVQKRLEKLQRCVETINDGINVQLEDNDLKIAQLMSSLDNVERRTETLQLFRTKIEDAIKKSDDCVQSTSEESTSNIHIRVHLENSERKRIPTIPMLEHGFPAADCESNGSELALLSHLIMSILKKENIPLKPIDAESAVPKQPTNSSNSCTHQ